ncbi:response regulator [Arboricoccus pini]|uniref:response regulator n=1 Tax=Arboricoccus pini TaxID=1963835 RepID=UPI0013FDF0E5|nr:response regulator [Arboricoccus pini]
MVEDEVLIRLMVTEELSFEGFDCHEAANGEEAIALIDAAPERFAVLVTDFHMPGSRDGVEVARHFRARHPGAPVIIITGRPDALAERYSVFPFDIVMHKPFTPSQLLASIRRLLGCGDADKPQP